MSRNSRFEHRDKRRKANMVLNILIGIVVVLILVVASSLLIFNRPPKDVANEPSKTAPASNEGAKRKVWKAEVGARRNRAIGITYSNL